MKKLAVVPLLVGVFFVAWAAPALANNDGRAPGDNCSQNPTAIGQPSEEAEPISGTNATSNPGSPPVSGPASDANPGESDGAQGDAKFNGGERC